MAASVMHAATGVMHAEIGVTHERTGISHPAMGALQFGMGVMHEAAQVTCAAAVVTPAGSVASCRAMPETQIPAVVIAEPSGALHGLPVVSSGSRRGGRAGLAVDRGLLAFSLRFHAEAPLLDQLLENPVEGAAVRLVVKRFADVAARERLGKTRQGGADVVFQISHGPASRRARGRGRSRLLLRRRRCYRSGLR